MAISRATPMATYWVHLHLVAASGAPQADVHPHPQHLPPAAAAGVVLFQFNDIMELQVHCLPAFPVHDFLMSSQYRRAACSVLLSPYS